MREVIMCGRPGRCCLTWHQYPDGSVVLKDDDGGLVTATKSEWEILKNKVKLGEI